MPTRVSLALHSLLLLSIPGVHPNTLPRANSPKFHKWHVYTSRTLIVFSFRFVPLIHTVRHLAFSPFVDFYPLLSEPSSPSSPHCGGVNAAFAPSLSTSCREDSPGHTPSSTTLGTSFLVAPSGDSPALASRPSSSSSTERLSLPESSSGGGGCLLSAGGGASVSRPLDAPGSGMSVLAALETLQAVSLRLFSSFAPTELHSAGPVLAAISRVIAGSGGFAVGPKLRVVRQHGRPCPGPEPCTRRWSSAHSGRKGPTAPGVCRAALHVSDGRPPCLPPSASIDSAAALPVRLVVPRRVRPLAAMRAASPRGPFTSCGLRTSTNSPIPARKLLTNSLVFSSPSKLGHSAAALLKRGR